MRPASSQPFYRDRRTWKLAACVIPVVLLLGLWWLVTGVLMVPPIPDAATPAGEVAQFIMHQDGLPRLDQRDGEAFMEQTVRRLVQDDAFLRRFVAEYRTASPEDQAAFRAHLFNLFKPIVMRDVERLEELEVADREAYLDDRIVQYNRLSRFWGSTTISKSMLGGGALTPAEIVEFLFNKTNERERELAVSYAKALAVRVEQILADPELKAEIEARIAGTPAQ